jgi:hypothetical protein
MKTIWKFPIPLKDIFTLEMPENASVIHVGLDPQGIPCLWAIVFTGAGKLNRRFLLHGTGHECSPLAKRETHIGTFIMGMLVLHLFEAE